MEIAPGANLTDGLFDVWFAGDLSRRETLRLLPTIFFGKHGRHRKVSHHRARTGRIESDTPLDVQIDGEIVESPPATFEVIPGALRIAG